MPTRYWRRGVSKLRFATAMAGSTPTAAEITAAVDLTPQIAEVTRTYDVAEITTPDWVTDFDPKIPGLKSAALAIKGYDLDGTTDDAIRAALPEGAVGWVFIMPKGNATGKRIEVWPVKVNAGPIDDYATGTEAARYDVSFSVTSKPNLNATIPS